MHTAKSDWGPANYPAVPGHEIIGRVEAVGTDVTKFKIGDVVGVGCMVESCQHCHSCDEGLEQYCENGFTGTYNSNRNQKSKDLTGKDGDVISNITKPVEDLYEEGDESLKN